MLRFFELLRVAAATSLLQLRVEKSVTDPSDGSEAPLGGFVDSTSNKLQLDASEQATLKAMQYWTPGDRPVPLTESYVLFTPDIGGPNNIRIGWEMTGVVAEHTKRTLVMPPATSMYLLDWGPMDTKYHPDELPHDTKTKVEDLLNLEQLKSRLPTMTASEFTAHTGVEWEEATRIAKRPGPSEKCSLPDYATMQDKFIFMDGNQPDRVGFSCGEWWQFGGPNEKMKKDFTEEGWQLLRHGFVWHDDMFRVAARVVNYLGLFNYVAMHARYNDFQYDDAQKPAAEIFAKWKTWLPEGTTLYLATDEPDKFKAINLPGVRLVMWDDLFQEATNYLLKDTKAHYNTERWFKIYGPVEELICTYAKLFVGNAQSSFSGHIERMRIHADAPVTMKLTHTDVFDTSQLNEQISNWESLHKSEDRSSRKISPTAYNTFLLQTQSK